MQIVFYNTDIAAVLLNIAVILSHGCILTAVFIPLPCPFLRVCRKSSDLKPPHRIVNPVSASIRNQGFHICPRSPNFFRMVRQLQLRIIGRQRKSCHGTEYQKHQTEHSDSERIQTE